MPADHKPQEDEHREASREQLGIEINETRKTLGGVTTALRIYALADLNHAVELKPTDVSTVLSISAGRVAGCPSSEFRDGMRQLADRVVELNDRSPHALVSRAQLLLGLSDWDAAQEDLEEILRSVDEIGHYDLYQAALVALATGDQDRYRELCMRIMEALADSDKAIEVHFAAWTCALAAGALEDYRPALAVAEKALEAEPENRRLHSLALRPLAAR